MKSSIKTKLKIGHLPNFQGLHILKIPAKTVTLLGGRTNLRVMIRLNKEIEFHAGFMPLGKGESYIMLSKARMKPLGLQYGDTVDVEIKKDQSKYGLPMPEELQTVLDLDTEASTRFENLSAGKKRTIIHYVGNVKNTDKRIERALFLMENLKILPEGKELIQKILGLKKSY
ncbi:MAG: YdeI/OmpD-associated family protein [Oligoflexia bacterium]|nr:YdeI/OmpD-associated family protein [Oligoflexia bacterium]